MKSLEIKHKVFGARNIGTAKVNIPENAHELLSTYSLVLVEYGDVSTQASIFVEKGEEDVLSISFNPKLKDAFKKVFKDLYHRLKET